MNITEFIVKFAEQFEETSIEEFNPNTIFKELEEYDSLIGMSIIALVDEVLCVKITGEEIRKTSTIEELFNYAISKK